MFKLNFVKPFVTIFCSLVLLSGLQTNAETFIYSPKNDLGIQDKFVFQVNPGDTVNNKLEIVNNNQKDSSLKLSVRDFTVTPEAALAPDLTQDQPAKTGSWIKLAASNIAIPAKKSAAINFTVQVPTNTPSGEYLALILAQPQAGAKTGVSVNISKSIKIFLQVKGEPKLSAKVENLNILDPKDQNFSQEVYKLGYSGKQNLVAGFTAENAGNLFIRLEGQYRLIQNGREVKRSLFSFDLAPSVGPRSFYIITNSPYAVGNNKLEFSYALAPQNLQSGSIIQDGNLPYLQNSLDLTQTDLDNFTSVRYKAIQTEQERLVGLSVNPQQNTVVKNDNKNNLALYILACLFVLIGGVGGVLVYIKFKKPRLWTNLKLRLQKFLNSARRMYNIKNNLNK